MKTAWLACAVALLVVPTTFGQVDLGPVIEPIDALLGDQIPPVLNATYGALGQNITREDVRMFLDMNVTKGGVGVMGLLLGSGKAELEASIQARVELRVISTERIRAAVEGENAYNITAQNATFLSEVYLPAEVFRASLSAEVIAAFQEEQERALRDYLQDTVPELEVLRLDFAWSHVHPFEVLGDTSLTEPPIILELDAAVRYLRVESVPSLLSMYLQGAKEPEDPKKAYIKELKDENSDPLRARDFFAAAAFSQLLNLSMQPGWALDIDVRLPRGYSIEYASQAIDVRNERHASIRIDALDEDTDVQSAMVFSLTHRKAVATALFVLMLAGVGILNLPGRWLHARYVLPKHRKRLATAS